MRPYAIEATIRLEFQDRWEKRSHGDISQIHRGHHRQKIKLQETSRLHKTKTARKMNLLKVLNSLSDINARIMKNIYTASMQSTLEYGSVTFAIYTGYRSPRIKGCVLFLEYHEAQVPRYELQMLPV